MKKLNLMLNDGKINVSVVYDCLEVLDVPKDQISLLVHKAQTEGQSVVYKGNKADCAKLIGKLKKYVKFKNSSEYSILVNNLLTIEKPKKSSPEIKGFSKEFKKQKTELIKYIKTLGIKTFEIDDANFYTINDEHCMDINDIECLELSKKSTYSEEEIKNRIIELNNSGVLAIVS